MENQLEQQLDQIIPEDITRTLESVYHVVFQGDHERIDDLLKHGGTLLRKAAQRFTSTQLILGIAAIAAVAVVTISYASQPDGLSDDTDEGEAQDVTKSDKKPKLRTAK